MKSNMHMWLRTIVNYEANATAKIKGSNKYPSIEGTANFWQTQEGVLVLVEASGLPFEKGNCMSKIFACHIHEQGDCSGNATEPFANVGMHYNPTKCPHPYHAGDLEPLFENDGYSFYLFLTNRFTVKEIIGKSIIIHSQRDDFATQPAGDSGEKIACGKIL